MYVAYSLHLKCAMHVQCTCLCVVGIFLHSIIFFEGSGKTTFLDLLTGRRKYGKISVR